MANGSRPSGVGAVLLWCVLVPVVGFLVLITCGLISVALGLLSGGADTPFKGTAWQVPFMMLAIFAVLILFLAHVASRLIASLRGKDVDHLIPPIAQLVFSLLLGLAGLGMMVAALLGRHTGRVYGGVTVIFLAHAAHVARKMWTARTLSPRLE